MENEESKIVPFGRKPTLKEVPVNKSAKEEPVITRMLILGGDEESEDFLAGMNAGAIFERLQQAQMHEVDVKTIAAMPMPAAYTKSLDKLAQFLRIKVTYQACQDHEDVLMCTFSSMDSQLTLV